jgi:antitoxin component of MazEF toxin-antitoxin module
MNNTQTLLRWGNGQGVRLPKKLTDMLNVSIGQIFNVSVEGNKVVLEANNDAQARVDAFHATIAKTRYIRFDRKYTREEMNER